jgi:hypothetical protein
MRRAVGILFLIAASGCASSGVRSRSTDYFVPIAEGLSSATITEGIRVAPRMFSAPQLTEACRDPRIVERLKVAPERLEMAPDGRYSLSSLSVVAVNGADLAMPGIPIVLEAEEIMPPVIALRSDDPDLNQGRLHAVRPGRFQMRIRTMCAGPQVERIIEARVN